jgi:hypothetical protein
VVAEAKEANVRGVIDIDVKDRMPGRCCMRLVEVALWAVQGCDEVCDVCWRFEKVEDFGQNHLYSRRASPSGKFDLSRYGVYS